MWFLIKGGVLLEIKKKIAVCLLLALFSMEPHTWHGQKYIYGHELRICSRDINSFPCFD